MAASLSLGNIFMHGNQNSGKLPLKLRTVMRKAQDVLMSLAWNCVTKAQHSLSHGGLMGGCISPSFQWAAYLMSPEGLGRLAPAMGTVWLVSR